MSIPKSTSPEPNHDDHQRKGGKRDNHRSLADSLAMPGLSDIDFDPPRVEIAPRVTSAVRDR